MGNLNIVYILDDNYRIMANILICENGTVVIQVNVLALRTCMQKYVEVNMCLQLTFKWFSKEKEKCVCVCVCVCVRERERKRGESSCGKFFNSCFILLKDNRVFIILFFQLFCGFLKFSK